MVNDMKETSMVILIVILFAGLIGLSIFTAILNLQIQNQNNNIEVIGSATEQINTLILENQKNAETILNLTKSIKELTAAQNSISSNIEIIKTELNDSVDWFVTNSKVTDPRITAKIEKCLSACTISLDCIATVNQKDLGIEFISDAGDEQLLSLDAFYNNGGGDCEDYALFYKAEYNYLREKASTCQTIINTSIYESGDYETTGEIYVSCAQTDTAAHCLNYIIGSASGKRYFIEPQWGNEVPDFLTEYPYEVHKILNDDLILQNYDTKEWYSYKKLLEEFN